MDYIIYRRISDKGNNIGIKLLKEGYYSPLTLLVARAINPTEYIDVNKLLKVSSLVKSEENSGQIIETMYYTDEFIMSEQEG